LLRIPAHPKQLDLDIDVLEEDIKTILAPRGAIEILGRLSAHGTSRCATAILEQPSCRAIQTKAMSALQFHFILVSHALVTNRAFHVVNDLICPIDRKGLEKKKL
jgi:hypothetical protein